MAHNAVPTRSQSNGVSHTPDCAESITGIEARNERHIPVAQNQKSKEEEHENHVKDDSHNNSSADPEQEGVVVKQPRRIIEMLTYIITIITLMFLSHCILTMQWLLPYYYTVATPFLLIVRIINYWRYKYQYFLLDFCYFGVTIVYVYIWACPGCPYYSMVVFGIANGLLSWGSVSYRNSLVPHSVDKLTSVYIHILPPMISYGARWYPDNISLHWYKPFSADYTEDIPSMFIWIAAVPAGCFLGHALLYAVVVRCLCVPGEDHLSSFTYLSQYGWLARFINACGTKHSFLTYCIIQVLYAISTTLLSILFYKYFIAHSVFLAALFIFVTWNGSTFYMYFLQERAFDDR